MHHDAKKMIAVEIRGRRQSLCQVRNRLAQTGGLHGLQTFTCHLLYKLEVYCKYCQNKKINLFVDMFDFRIAFDNTCYIKWFAIFRKSIILTNGPVYMNTFSSKAMSFSIKMH